MLSVAVGATMAGGVIAGTALALVLHVMVAIATVRALFSAVDSIVDGKRGKR